MGATESLGPITLYSGTTTVVSTFTGYIQYDALGRNGGKDVQQTHGIGTITVVYHQEVSGLSIGVPTSPGGPGNPPTEDADVWMEVTGDPMFPSVGPPEDFAVYLGDDFTPHAVPGPPYSEPSQVPQTPDGFFPEFAIEQGELFEVVVVHLDADPPADPPLVRGQGD